MKFSELLVDYLYLRDKDKDAEFIDWARRGRMMRLLAEMDKLIKGTTQ